MGKLTFSGAVLYLSDDPDKVASQLAGETLTLAEAGTLRDDISTDEITPAASMTHFDERLAETVYTGFKSGDRIPFSLGDVRRGSFSVTVAGKRYGKGSSREQSPQSEQYAGIRLVIAESFERIYRQNADNIGLLTSTDFGLIARIQAGEGIDIEEILAGRDTLAASIVRADGLLAYGNRQLAMLRPAVQADDGAPLTLCEKILRRHAVQTDDNTGAVVPGNGIFTRADWRFIIEVYSGMAMHRMESAFGDPVKLADPASIRGFAEHLPLFRHAPAAQIGTRLQDMDALYQLHVAFCRKYGIQSHGHLRSEEGSEGICHPIMTERYALPSQVVVGTDSHTPHAGALGCLAFGVGTTEMANAMMTGAVRLTVPETILIDVQGRLPSGVDAKDLVLHLLALPDLKRGSGLARIFEFSGPVIREMSIDDRATLTNMAAELGGFTGIVAPDAETVRFLEERRGVAFEIEDWMRSDPGARYADVISVDASSLSPFVAAPGDPGNGQPLSLVADRPKIDIAFGGSCTGGKREDFDAYHEVLSWAVKHGRRTAPGVRLYLQFGTLDVRRYCEEQQYMATFAAADAEMLAPACGACANAGPGASSSSGQVTVSAQNRNFPGRSGPGQVWLASPATVAASAIAGRLVSFNELVEQVGTGVATGG